MGNHDERAAYSRELFGEESDAPAGPGVRRRRAADHQPRHQRARLAPRRDHRRAAGLAARRAGDAGRARHDPGPAPPADPVADVPGRGDHRAARHRPAGRGAARAATSGRSSAGTTTSRRTRPSPASRSRSRRRPATSSDPAPLDRFISAVDGHSRSTSSTCTPTASCTRSSRCRTRRR